jgi:hypothetical protein
MNIMFATRLKVTMAVLLTAMVLAGAVRSDDAAKKDEKAGAAGSPADALRGRLQKYEDDIGKIRQAMLKECAEEEQRLEDARKKAKEDMDRAKKGKDKDAAAKASAALQQATADKTKVTQLRLDVEKRLAAGASGAGKPIEERIGLKTSTLTPLVREQLGIGKAEGLAVDKVTPGSLADRIGLKTNDVLVKIDDRPVPGSLAPFRTLLTALKADKSVEVVVVRHAKQETLKGLTAPAPE